MNKDSKILITGSKGMVGKNLVKKLIKEGYTDLLMPNSNELDLRNQKEVNEYFNNNNIEYIFHLAAKVGGIAANISYPAEFIYDNLMIECNVIEAAKVNKTKKLLFLGSSCIYPTNSPQPMKEEYLLSGRLEPTNEGYALAKICGLKLCEFYNKQYGTNFISIMAPNLYGPMDHFNSANSHVISALISKFHNAKETNKEQVEVWGTGKAKREFLYVGDLVNCLIYFMKEVDHLPSFINVGSGEDISIKNIANLISKIIGYKGNINFNKSKPDGMLKKKMDISKFKEFGFKVNMKLEMGLKKTYESYLK